MAINPVLSVTVPMSVADGPMIVNTVTIHVPTANLMDGALREVARQRNVKDRVAKLQSHEDIPGFKKVMMYAHNPYIRFGVNISASVRNHLIGKVDLRNSAPLGIESEEVWDVLDNLRHSTASSSSKIEELSRLYARLDLPTAYLVTGILEKNMVKGVAASTVNKAWPGLIPTFDVQLSAKYTDRKVKKLPAFVELKYDGMRCITLVHPTGEVEFCSRSGRPIPAAKLFEADALKMAEAYKAVTAGTPYHGVVFDGELLGESFNDTVSIFRSNEVAESGRYQVFDVLPMEVMVDPAFVSEDYQARRGLLVRVMERAATSKCPISPSYQVNSKAEIWDLYNRSREMGFEGVIVKTADGRWQGKRSNDWLKIKAEETLDLTVIGAFEGEGELEGSLGGLIVDYNGEQVRVGSGFSRADRDLLFGDFLQDLEESNAGGTDFKLFGNTAEVQYQEITPAGSLRHPVFVRLRKDKDEVSF